MVSELVNWIIEGFRDEIFDPKELAITLDDPRRYPWNLRSDNIIQQLYQTAITGHDAQYRIEYSWQAGPVPSKPKKDDAKKDKPVLPPVDQGQGRIGDNPGRHVN